MNEFQWTQLAILATGVGTFLASEYRAARDRRWLERDREEAKTEAVAERKAATAEIIERAAAEAEATRIKTEAIAVSLRQHTALTAARLREEARVGAEELVHQAALIAEDLKVATAHTTAETREELATLVNAATVAAKEAYVEANSVNVKIENLNKRLLADESSKVTAANSAAAVTIEKIDATTERIEKKIAKP